MGGGRWVGAGAKKKSEFWAGVPEKNKERGGGGLGQGGGRGGGGGGGGVNTGGRGSMPPCLPLHWWPSSTGRNNRTQTVEHFHSKKLYRILYVRLKLVSKSFGDQILLIRCSVHILNVFIIWYSEGHYVAECKDMSSKEHLFIGVYDGSWRLF